MDRIFTLHADHEQNASTSTVRLAGSTGANPCMYLFRYFCTLGTITRWCKRSCTENADEIGSVENVAEFMEKKKRKEVKLMGLVTVFTKNFDPRAKVMKETCDEVLEVHWVSMIHNLRLQWNLSALRLANTSLNVNFIQT